MKFLVTIIMLFHFATPAETWLTDFEQAKKEAAKSKKLILLSFSGSDWCSPCMELKREVFNSPEFNALASANLILINADFPRQKKHKISDEQVKKNESLAAIYNKKGSFPETLVLDSDGKVLKEWSGYPEDSADEFVKKIKAVVDANH